MSGCKCGSKACNFVQADTTNIDPPSITYGWSPGVEEEYEGYCPELVGKKVIIHSDSPRGEYRLKGVIEKVDEDYILLDTAFIRFSNILYVEIIKD